MHYDQELYSYFSYFSSFSPFSLSVSSSLSLLRYVSLPTKYYWLPSCLNTVLPCSTSLIKFSVDMSSHHNFCYQWHCRVFHCIWWAPGINCYVQPYNKRNKFDNIAIKNRHTELKNIIWGKIGTRPSMFEIMGPLHGLCKIYEHDK